MIPVCEPKMSEKELEYVADCVKTNWISSKGKYITEFEEKFSKYCGTKFGIACSSGTTALHLALASAGIKSGDEVIIPDFTMIATANSVTYTGAKFALVDSEPETWNIDPNKIEEKITKRTKAIMIMHTYGHPCLTGDTEVVAFDGKSRKHMSIQEAVSQRIPYVLGVENGEIQPVRVFRHSIRLWVGKIVEIELEDGVTVKATPDHIFPIYNEGWIPIISVAIGKYLYILKSNGYKGRNNEKVDVNRKKASKKSLSIKNERRVASPVSKFNVDPDSSTSKRSWDQKKMDVDKKRSCPVKRDIPKGRLKRGDTQSPSKIYVETDKTQSAQLGFKIFDTTTRLKHFERKEVSTDESLGGVGKSLFGGAHRWGGNNYHNKLQRLALPHDLVIHNISRNQGFYESAWAIYDTPKEETEKQARDLSVYHPGLSESPATTGVNLPLFESQEAPVPVGDEIHIGAPQSTGRDTILERGLSHLSKIKEIELKKIKSIKITDGTCLVYDLTTESGNFFANGILVHNCDMDPILELAGKHDLYVIEDAAEAHGAEYKGKRTGGLGDMGCFSFYANKIITTGEGGMVVTNNEEFAERARMLRDQAFEKEKRFWHRHLGFNYRLTNLQAAIGVAQFERIDEFVETRRRNARYYNSLLEKIEGITLPPEAKWAKNVYWMYTILIEKNFGLSRDDLMARLKERGVDSRRAFYPIHVQPLYAQQFTGQKFPVADKLSDKGVYLPSGNTLTKEQIDQVVETLISIQKGAK